MRRMITLAATVALTLAAGSAAFAQQSGGQPCGNGKGQVPCQTQDTGGQGKGGQDKARKTQDATGKSGAAADKGGHKEAGKSAGKTSGKSGAPQAGESGRKGQPFQRADNSRFKAPPSGQDYRVVDDHLVLVDKNTLKIVTVLGLLDTLLK